MVFMAKTRMLDLKRVSQMKSLRLLLIGTACSLVFCLSSAFGDVVGDVTFPVSPGGSGSAVVGGSSEISVEKTYTSIDEIIMEVTVDTVGSYSITETITNNSGVSWVDFNWELGTLTNVTDNTYDWGGITNAKFTSPDNSVQTSSGNNLTLDRSDTGYLKLVGDVPAEDSFTFNYSVEVTDLDTSGSFTFAVKQYDAPPPVPAPSASVALASLFVTLGGTVLLRRRKR